MIKRFLGVIGCSFTLLLATGCGDDDAMVRDGNDPDAGPPTTPDLDEEWTKIEPGGDTICARGDAFHFFVRGGTRNRLAIVFDGGGACWNALTCSIGDALFAPTADEELPEPGEGIGDNTNEENPFRDWYQVFIPYCTADVHWGDSVTTYEPEGDAPEITIHHKGQANTKAVLDWIYERFSGPETIFVTGMSAGSYGSIGWAPHIMEHYPDSYVAQLGDCGAGVITDDFFTESFPSWNADAILPEWFDVPIEELALEDLYIEVANHYQDNFFGQVNTHNDENQRFYYTAMGGKEEDWSPAMYEKIEAILDETSNFRSYIAGGDKHVVLPYPELYTYEVDGTRLRDWVADIADGESVETVHCTKCDEPELFEP